MPTDPVQRYPAFQLVGFNCNIHYCWCDVTIMYDCWSLSFVKRHVCWFSTTLLNMLDFMGVGYDELVALHGSCSVKRLQICTRTWYYSIRHVSWSTGNQKEKLLDRCPSIRHANSHCETYQPRPLQCQYNILVHAVYRIVMSLQLQHICLLP